MTSGESHRCYGCHYDGIAYRLECAGCRRKDNLRFNTPNERSEFVVLPDKYTGVVTYGVTKILKRSKDM